MQEIPPPLFFIMVDCNFCVSELNQFVEQADEMLARLFEGENGKSQYAISTHWLDKISLVEGIFSTPCIGCQSEFVLMRPIFILRR